MDKELKEVFERINSKKENLEDIKKRNKEQTKKNKLMQVRNDCWEFLLRKQEEFASEELVNYIKEENFIYSTKDDLKSEVWVYTDGIYKPNGESHIKEIVRSILGRAYTPQRVNKVISKIKADNFIDSDKFFNKIYLDEIPIKNGILNLKTCELTDFTPHKIFFNKLPVEYNPNATCPHIQKFFEEILKTKDDAKVMFEIFGYCLWKNHFIEKAIMLVGDGRNGKGKTISLLKSFLGAENCCAVTLSQLIPSSTSVSELFGKYANLAGDLSNRSLKETGLFKEITGRDMIGAKRKYLNDLFFINYSKQVFACNQLPKVYDYSEGFWERWVLLEFPYKFIPRKEYEKLTEKEKEIHKIQDALIIDKITTKEELSGLLNMAIVSLKNILKNKNFSYSKGSEEIKNFWIRKSDSFMAFCLDNLEEDNTGYIFKKDLRKEFSRYCKKHKLKGASDKAIKVILEDMFGTIEGKKEIFGQWDVVWEGIRFKERKDK